MRCSVSPPVCKLAQLICKTYGTHFESLEPTFGFGFGVLGNRKMYKHFLA